MGMRTRADTKAWLRSAVDGALKHVRNDHPDFPQHMYLSIKKRVTGTLLDAMDKKVRKEVAEQVRQFKQEFREHRITPASDSFPPQQKYPR